MAQPDLAVYGPGGELELVVEVKNRSGASPEWVAQLRRNLLADSIIPNARYFLLALPDFFYLWKDGTSSADIAPDYQIDTTQILESYTNGVRESLNDLSGYGFELLVSAWLEDLVHSDLEPKRIDPHLRWLFDSGLYEAVKNGSIAIEAAV